MNYCEHDYYELTPEDLSCKKCKKIIKKTDHLLELESTVAGKHYSEIVRLQWVVIVIAGATLFIAVISLFI
jgi:hypothetical protein